MYIRRLTTDVNTSDDYNGSLNTLARWKGMGLQHSSEDDDYDGAKVPDLESRGDTVTRKALKRHRELEVNEKDGMETPLPSGHGKQASSESRTQSFGEMRSGRCLLFPFRFMLSI